MKKILVLILTLVVCSPLFAEVNPATMFSDNMVLEQKSEVPVWGTADSGEKVTVKGSWQWFWGESTTADENGKWMVRIPTPSAGGPYTLTVKGNNEIKFEDVMIGEVWVCSGQSNMEWPMDRIHNAKKEITNADYPNIRLYKIPRRTSDQPRQSVNSSWVKCSAETIVDVTGHGPFSAVGYFFGRYLNEKMDVPVGLIETAYGGTPAQAWTEMSVLQKSPRLQPFLENWDQQMQSYKTNLEEWEQKAEQAKQNDQEIPDKPSGPWMPGGPAKLYNAMLNPVIPYGIRGVTWYQGEANVGKPHLYHELFSTMIGCWRESWGQGDFPFYFVQIAPYTYHNPNGVEAALIREAQLETMHTVPNTGMVVPTDITDDVTNIHPKNKQDVGKRLALWALAKTYGYKNIIYSGPIYKSMEKTGQKIRLYFDYVDGGLVAREELRCFEIAGPDKDFYPAQAKIESNTVLVWNENVEYPTAVRFGWSNSAVPNLFNQAGLPASPFRTDNWNPENK